MAPVLLADAGILATSGMHKHKSAPIGRASKAGPNTGVTESVINFHDVLWNHFKRFLFP